MGRKGKIWVSMVMIISICLEIVLPNIGTTAIMANETLPFEFEKTDYGVVDSNVVAKKLKILNFSSRP